MIEDWSSPYSVRLCPTYSLVHIENIDILAALYTFYLQNWKLEICQTLRSISMQLEAFSVFFFEFTQCKRWNIPWKTDKSQIFYPSWISIGLWPRPYWTTLEQISTLHTQSLHNVQRLQITDLRPKPTYGFWGLSFCCRIKIDVACNRPW